MISALKGPGEVESEILMSSLIHKGSFLVLEGDDDCRFWSPRVHKTNCEIIIGGGKPAVVGGIERLDKVGLRNAVGVVDDDCDRLRQIAPSSANLVHTDTRDMEGVLLRSTALLKVLAEFGDTAKIERFERAGETVRDALLRRALPLGRLRWLCYNRGADVDFEKLRVARFVESQNWAFDESALLDVVAAQGKLGPRPELDVELARLPAADPWQICQGHDLIDLLGFGFQRVLGNRNPGSKKIASVLRAGIDSHELEQLELYRDLRAWEVNHSPLRVLP